MRKIARKGRIKASKDRDLDYQDHPIILQDNEVEVLLRDLCVQLGFCLPPSLQVRLVRNPPKTPHRFTDVILVAEGIGSNRGSDMYEYVFSYVLKAFRHSNAMNYSECQK